jgi:hypothetical protein
VTLPNFLIIGAQKAGTSSLYYYLKQHPDVYMSPVKEPHFFAIEGGRANFRSPGAEAGINRKSVADSKEYEALFDGARGEKAIGEASTSYLYSPEAPGRVEDHLPEAKFIAVLRDPAERAYSTFLALRLGGREPLEDFSHALEAERERIESGWEHIWHYKNLGFYHDQLSRYGEALEEGRMRIYLYEDLSADPRGVVRDAYRFLGVDDSFVPDTAQRHNMSGVSKNGFLVSLVRKRHPVKTAIKPLVPAAVRRRLVSDLQERVLSRPPFPPEARRELVEAYREDVVRLQDLIGRDLSAWLR